MRSTTLLFVLALAAASAAQGDLLVSSDFSHSVKRYDGLTGAYLGDFVTAGSGGLNRPQGISVGPDGNVYVSSAGSGRVLRYDGVSGAFMGAFTQGPALGFAADMEWRNGTLYVSDFQQNGYVNRYDSTGAYLGRFTSDTYPGSDGILFDASGNMYVSSFGPGAVRRYDPSGNFLGLFVTNGSGGITGSLDLSWASNGDLLVSSFQTGKVKRYSGTSGAYLGDAFSVPGATQGQATGLDGMFYAGNYTGHSIHRFDPNTGAHLGVFASGGGLNSPNNFVFRPVPEPLTVSALTLGIALFVRRKK